MRTFFFNAMLRTVTLLCCLCVVSARALTIVVINDTLTGQSGAQIYWGTTLASRYGCWTTGYIPAGSSASENFATEDYGDPNVTQIFTYENSSFVQTQPQSFLTDSNGATDGQTATFYLGPVESCTTNLVWNILNSDTVNHFYFAEDTVGDQSGQLYLTTGQSGILSVTGTACTNVWTVHYVNSITFDNGSNSLDGVVYQGPTLPTQPSESGSAGGEGSPTAPGTGTGNGPQLLGGSAPGVGQYNPTNPAVAGTNSPIIFSSSPTNAEGTIIAQGDQALYTATVNGFNQDAVNQQKEISDLNVIASNGVAGATGTNGGFTLTNYATATGQNSQSNLTVLQSVTLTNGFNTVSNGLSNVVTAVNGLSSNLLTLSNLVNYTATNLSSLQSSGYSNIWASTNGAQALSESGVVSHMPSGWSDTFAGGDSPPGASMSVQLFAAPDGSGAGTLSLSTSNVPTTYNLCRTLLLWFIYLVVFISCWNTFQRSMTRVMQTQQASTSGTAFFGSNVNIASALIMAGAIVAAAAVLCTYAIPKLIVMVELIVGNPLSGLTGFAYDWIDTFVPIPTLLASVGVVMFFRLTVDSLAAVAQGIIKFLVGL